jgi:sodium/potassium/calcium exchanger 6
MNSYGNEFSLVGVPCSLALFIWFFYKWRYCPQADNGDVMYPGSAVLLCSGVLAFVTSVAWMNIQANEVVALLETIGIVFDVNIGEFRVDHVYTRCSVPNLCLFGISSVSAVLGVTVLAIGNSVGDWVADTTVARKGKPAMGFSSCFGSPLLNDVLGLGISLTVRNKPCIRSGK